MSKRPGLRHCSTASRGCLAPAGWGGAGRPVIGTVKTRGRCSECDAGLCDRCAEHFTDGRRLCPECFDRAPERQPTCTPFTIWKVEDAVGRKIEVTLSVTVIDGRPGAVLGVVLDGVHWSSVLPEFTKPRACEKPVHLKWPKE